MSKAPDNASGAETVALQLVSAALAYDDARARRSAARTLQRKLLKEYLGNEGSYYDATVERDPEIDAALAEGRASSKAKISAHAKLLRAIKAARAALNP
jgi:hypothetical protein